MALPCPSCRQPLGINLEFILKNPISVCPNCNTIFNFNVDEDTKRLYKEAISEINKIKKEYKGSVKFG